MTNSIGEEYDYRLCEWCGTRFTKVNPKWVPKPILCGPECQVQLLTLLFWVHQKHNDRTEDLPFL